MTTATISTYYCAFCSAVSKQAKKTLTNFMSHCEVIGAARAAAELNRMGMHEEAKRIILNCGGGK
tara:strand:+ start:251 stop:445 length:195 start_codon:yes stop_codon:yes gene_type:complete